MTLVNQFATIFVHFYEVFHLLHNPMVYNWSPHSNYLACTHKGYNNHFCRIFLATSQFLVEAEKGNFARFRNLRDAGLRNLRARKLRTCNWQFATLNLAHPLPNVQYNGDVIVSGSQIRTNITQKRRYSRKLRASCGLAIDPWCHTPPGWSKVGVN